MYTVASLSCSLLPVSLCSSPISYVTNQCFAPDMVGEARGSGLRVVEIKRLQNVI